MVIINKSYYFHLPKASISLADFNYSDLALVFLLEKSLKYFGF